MRLRDAHVAGREEAVELLARARADDRRGDGRVDERPGGRVARERSAHLLRHAGERLDDVEPARRVHETVRRLITRMIEDVIAETGRRAVTHKPSLAELRRAVGPLVAFSPTMQKADADVKGFLYPRMYRHDRVMRVMGDAENVVRGLFAHYVETPADLPVESMRLCFTMSARLYPAPGD